METIAREEELSRGKRRAPEKFEVKRDTMKKEETSVDRPTSPWLSTKKKRGGGGGRESLKR